MACLLAHAASHGSNGQCASAWSSSWQVLTLCLPFTCLQEWAKAVTAGKMTKGDKLGVVDHSTINYPPCRKNFYIEVGGGGRCAGHHVRCRVCMLASGSGSVMQHVEYTSY
jgi:hypothetical protein